MYFCLLIAKIFFIVLCPGNKLRYGKEIIDWYKEYNNFNFIYKIYIGLTYSTGVLFANPYIIPWSPAPFTLSFVPSAISEL